MNVKLKSVREIIRNCEKTIKKKWDKYIKKNKYAYEVWDFIVEKIYSFFHIGNYWKIKISFLKKKKIHMLIIKDANYKNDCA